MFTAFRRFLCKQACTESSESCERMTHCFTIWFFRRRG
jgi:hypothetical protein